MHSTEKRLTAHNAHNIGFLHPDTDELQIFEKVKSEN